MIYFYKWNAESPLSNLLREGGGIFKATIMSYCTFMKPCAIRKKTLPNWQKAILVNIIASNGDSTIDFSLVLRPSRTHHRTVLWVYAINHNGKLQMYLETDEGNKYLAMVGIVISHDFISYRYNYTTTQNVCVLIQNCIWIKFVWFNVNKAMLKTTFVTPFPHKYIEISYHYLCTA